MWLQTVNRTFFIGLAKLFFIYIPACLVVFALCYFVGTAMLVHGLKTWLFGPVTVAILILLYLFKILLGPTMTELRKEHDAKRGRSEG